MPISRRLLVPALLVGCNGVPPEDAGLAFASLISGKVHVLEVSTLRSRLVVDEGHAATLGVAPTPDQRGFYYGSQDTLSLERIALAEDLSSFQVLRRLPIPGPIRGVMGSRDGSMVGVTSQSYDLPFDDAVFFVRPGDGAHEVDDLLAFTFHVPTSPPPLGPDGKLARPCPCPRLGLTFTPDGSRAFVVHAYEHSISVIDTRTFTVLDTFSLEPRAPTGQPWLGPECDGPTTSPDGRWLAVPGLEAERVVFVRTEDTSVRRVLETPGELPLEVGFSDDGRTAWVATADAVPVAGEELRNAMRRSALHKVDLESLRILASARPSVALTQVAMPRRGGLVLVGGSFGLIASYDADLQLRGEANLSSAPMPLFGLDL